MGVEMSVAIQHRQRGPGPQVEPMRAYLTRRQSLFPNAGLDTSENMNVNRDDFGSVVHHARAPLQWPPLPGGPLGSDHKSVSLACV
jgi:hypothetical protein